MDSSKKLQLSPYAIIRRNGDEMYLEQPLSNSVVPVQKSSILNLLFRFAKPTACEEILQAAAPESRNQISRLLDFLIEKKILIAADSAAGEEIKKEMWEFHDLMFHTQSRRGLNFRPVGATYRFGKENFPNGFIRADRRDGEIELPEIETGFSSGFTLDEAFRERHSSYKFSSVELSDISNLLDGSVRTGQFSGSANGRKKVHRNYPSGGGLYSLETYLAVIDCADLPRGLYRYDSLKHKMSLIPNQEKFVLSAGEDAAKCMAQEQMPAVVLIFSSRFEQVFFKYESLAYRLILLELGAIFQTLYLAAAKLKLSVCALGSGNSTEFSDNLGLEYLKETSVGEFAVNGKF